MVLAKLSNKVVVDQEVAALVDATLSLERGATITRDEITQTTGIEYKSREWFKLVRKWQQAILEKRGAQIAWNATANAYQLLSGPGQVADMHRRQHLMRKNSKRIAAVAAMVPDDLLTADGRKIRDSIVASGTSVAASLEKELKTRKPLLRSIQPLPRIGN